MNQRVGDVVWVAAVVVAVVVSLPGALAQTGEARCEDTARNCAQLVRNGACATSPATMGVRCRASCNLCVPPESQPEPPARERERPLEGILAQKECGRPVTSSRRRAREARPQRGNDGGSFSAEDAQVSTPQVRCGASVISDRYIVTSATCVVDPNHPVFSVRLGELDLSREGEAHSQPQDYDIQQIFVHPDFDPSSPVLYNDIALLQTRRRIVFNEAVFPYCLSARTPHPGTRVIGSGFGLVNETHASPHLQEGELRVMRAGECEDLYRVAGDSQRLRTAYPSPLTRGDVLCAGHPGRGPCKGDEGGPLYLEDAEGRRSLVGITSFTGPCVKEGLLPALFTDLAHHTGFITAILSDPSLTAPP